MSLGSRASRGSHVIQWKVQHVKRNDQKMYHSWVKGNNLSPVKYNDSAKNQKMLKRETLGSICHLSVYESVKQNKD